ncbi:MAG: SGNH/GDSL hydrolase family protein [Candidatus Woesearchaeota archaeon]
MINRILCFGDSITLGVGDSKSLGWVGRLNIEHHNKNIRNFIYNLGDYRETSSDLIKRFEKEATSRFKKTEKFSYSFIISIGINDTRINLETGKEKVDINKFKNNIKKLISICKKNKKEVIFLGLTPVIEKKVLNRMGSKFINSKIRVYNEVIKKECEKNNIEFIHIFDKIKEDMLLDGLHLNEKGYNLITNNIKKVLKNKKWIN